MHIGSFYTKALFLTLGATVLMGCTQSYRDEIIPPTQEKINAAKSAIEPSKSMSTGVFHMQRVNAGSSVRSDAPIRLRRPDLPPFDVAYVSRDLESVVLELSNAAGESVVIPEGVRGRTITLIHSGADFPTMLDLVLRKAGYSYNYIDGIFYITRYPVRNYTLEISQSDRKGALATSAELGRESGDSEASSLGPTGAVELNTDYSDKVWEQVEDTLKSVINVGTDLTGDAATRTRATGFTGDGRFNASAPAAGGSGSSVSGAGGGQILLLEPPSLTGDQPAGGGGVSPTAAVAEAGPGQTVDVTNQPGGGVRPTELSQLPSTDHLAPATNEDPFYKITRSAGLITVRTSPEAHRLIENYLEQVQQAMQRQVLVETRIVAIIREKTTDRGANFSQNITPGAPWGKSLLSVIGFRATEPLSSALTEQRGGFATFSTSEKGGDFNLVLRNLSTLGDLYNISSPSVLARNNQISRVSVTRQLGYVETAVTTNTNAAGETVVGQRTDTVKFKNAGTVVSVLPFIGKSKVQLRIRLSVARQRGSVEVQTSIGGNDPVTNQIPELANDIIDQDLIMDFGRVYAIGGLVETSTNIDATYAPGMKDIPGLGEVFRRANNSQQDTDFIVLLRVSRS